MDAIVIAGGVPKPDSLLYPYTNGQPKALVDMCGKPMAQWVLDALCDADSIDRVVVIGLPDGSPVTCEKAQAFIPSHGDMLDNIRAGVNQMMELNPDAEKVILVSSDIPTIDAEAINWVVNEASKTEADVYYNVVTRDAMESRFPGSSRSYVHFRDVSICGGDMNVARTALVRENDELWKRIIAARKNVFKQAALIGYDTLILLLLRVITIDGVIKRVARRLNIVGRALICPYAEVAMDVDKPHQLEMLRADLAKR
ncbi:NTP transferase domain-containing protein [Chloroflexota bacterium]